MSELIVSRQQRVLLLTLNRPAARNALNNALLMQLVNELEAAATDTSISVCVITGNARFFAAGADLNEMAEKDLAATLNDTRPQLWARLQAFNKPLIAAVNGYALGAGCELALLCDVVVAGENARFGLPEITLGIMPGAGGTQRLIRSVGKSLASKMVLSGESITAQQAQQAGLVSDVFPSDLTLEYALQLASKMQQELVIGGRLGKKSGLGVYDWRAEREAVVGLEAVSDSFSPMKVEKKSDGVTEIDDVLLIETQGETAQALAIRLARPVVVIDKMAGKVVTIAAAAVNPDSATRKAIYYLQQQGKTVLQIADYPGMLIWRTVAMIINEALDALQKGVASEQDIDTAMRLGVNYPYGPLAWGAQLGWQRILRLLENLQHHYGEERYRPCSLLRQRALLESGYES